MNTKLKVFCKKLSPYFFQSNIFLKISQKLTSSPFRNYNFTLHFNLYCDTIPCVISIYKLYFADNFALCTLHLYSRVWRNWQTRQIQVTYSKCKGLKCAKISDKIVMKITLKKLICGCGGTGRRTRLRIQRSNLCRFNSCHPHHRSKPYISRLWAFLLAKEKQSQQKSRCITLSYASANFLWCYYLNLVTIELPIVHIVPPGFLKLFYQLSIFVIVVFVVREVTIKLYTDF